MYSLLNDTQQELTMTMLLLICLQSLFNLLIGFFFFSHGTIKFGMELLFVSALVLWSDPCALLFMYYVNHNLRKQSFSPSTDKMLKIKYGKTSHLFFHHSWFFFSIWFLVIVIRKTTTFCALMWLYECSVLI